MSEKLKKNILVTGTGGRSVGAGILHSLLRTGREVRNRWNVIATDAVPFSWGLYVADNGELLPHANEPNYITELNKIIKKHQIHAVIPGTEIEIEKMANFFHEIKVPVIANRKKLIPLMMDKFMLQETLLKLGVSYIETSPVSNWEKVAKKYGFPLIIKPTKGTGASRGLHIVATEKELLNIIPFLNPSSVPCVQPYIGNSDEEYTVGVLSNIKGEIIDSIVMKRNLIGLSLLYSRKMKDKEYAISTGYSQGYIVKHNQIQSFCEKVAFDIGSTGPLNIQLRLVGSEIYIFEIHPRFSGTTPIRADVGFNEVDILLRNRLFNEEFGRINYKHNIAAIRAFEHVIVPIAKLKKPD